MGGSEVLLEESLQSVCQRLNETEELQVLLEAQEGGRKAHPVGPHPVLDDGAHAAFRIG